MVAVGVRNATDDVAALRWAAAEAMPQDALHLVHAFVPLRLYGCHWDPVRRLRDARALTAQRVTNQAVQRLRAMRVDLGIDGSAVAGLPEDVLIEFSEIVDLLVMGDDSSSVESRRLSWRVQDQASCPVICVPSTVSRFDAPVTVVVDERGLRPAALRFGIDWARRHDVNVQVSRTWTSLHEDELPSPTLLAQQLEELDAQLAEWQLRDPQVGIVARLELADDWLGRVSAKSSMLVVGRGSAAAIRPRCAPPLRCPTVVVPE